MPRVSTSLKKFQADGVRPIATNARARYCNTINRAMPRNTHDHRKPVYPSSTLSMYRPAQRKIAIAKGLNGSNGIVPGGPRSGALAASSRAVSLLSKDTLRVSGTVAYSDRSACSGCGVCIDICPYAAPRFIEEGSFAGKAEINPVLCKGCGLCVSSCRSGALNLNGFETGQIMEMINQS